MKKIYVCSALRGDVEQNQKMARVYCEYIVKEFGHIPVAPHIYFTQFLDDNIDSEREFGIKAGLFLLSECDELWYFGDQISRGMTDEICKAMGIGMKVQYVPEYKYEKYKQKESLQYEME